MILDTLDNASRYTSLHARFGDAFDFLRRADLQRLSDGRHEIMGDKLFAIIDHGFGRGRENSLLEFHRNYIDIQFVVNGCDQIGWLPLSECQRVSQPYDAGLDLGFYYDRPKTWLEVTTGSFAVFFPSDAHAPLGGNDRITKAVIKVATAS